MFEHEIERLKRRIAPAETRRGDTTPTNDAAPLVLTRVPLRQPCRCGRSVTDLETIDRLDTVQVKILGQRF